MRLLQLQDGGFSLVQFVGSNIPPYAILSHTWGPSNEEVTYQDLLSDTGEEKSGYRKLTFCGEQAAKDGLQYFWIDTCCIDKSSSAELSEAITSMFRWYHNSAKCYVYLSDVLANKRKADCDTFSCTWELVFRTSKWFSRGWTLQELLAPPVVIFFSGEGKQLGDKASLEQQIHEITHIPISALGGAPLCEFDIEERMSWRGKRQTTREEDEAYSLLGIFNISMLPNYGEGKKSAFKRLRKEIRETLGDQNLPLREEQKRILLDSLRFDQIDARQTTIKNAHVKTCKWLLKNPRYLDWLDFGKLSEHHGFLWIKGKPGTGKSTLMKFALINARKTMKDIILLSFFFNARGEYLEKSTIGTYRSLLLQLLERLPGLQSVFGLLGLSTSSFSTNHQWNVESLKTLMEQAIRALGKSSVVCFIDALDECEEEQIRDMIQFFEHIGELAVSNGIHFQVCFSSRHYPHITIKKGLDVVLEGQEGHSQDIINYIETELKIGKSKIAQQIRAELQEKASGVFMWVVLVVGILNKEYDGGRMYALRRRLQEIPGDLHELFRTILTRDSRNKDELMLCIQWVLFAKQPLNPEQLYFAVLSGVEPEAALEWDCVEITADVIKRFILDSSKGLAEVTTSKPQKVQFIHESVRDFLLKENGLSNTWPELGSNLQGQSHERLKQCCLTYMNIDLSARLEIPECLPTASSQQAAGLRKDTTKAFPFLEYASQNVLYHADAAEGCDISQVHFLDSFPLPRWIKLHNLFEKMEVRRYTESVSSLYVLAELNLANLIKVHPSIKLYLEPENERYGCPLFAAIATGSMEAVKACIRGMEANQATHNSSCELNEQNFNYESLRHAAKRNFNYSKQRGIFSCAVELGHEDVFDHLISSGKFETDSKDSKGRTPLWWASKNGCGAIVKLLLSIDTIAIDSKDKHGKTPLYVAVEWRNNVVVELLINKGADVNAQGGHYGNALQAASCGGHKEIVTLLVEKGADVNAQGGHYGNALYAASWGGHKEIVTLLVDKGADVNAQGGKYCNALQAASGRGHKEIVTLLVDKGAVR
jgi:ankyrin repeat protein